LDHIVNTLRKMNIYKKNQEMIDRDRILWAMSTKKTEWMCADCEKNGCGWAPGDGACKKMNGGK